MHWQKINTEQALEDIKELSLTRPVLLFKHSYRCSISALALSRLERSWNLPDATITPIIIDVVNQRNISQAAARLFDVMHESPQALLIKEGECVYNASHTDIYYKDIAQLIEM